MAGFGLYVSNALQGVDAKGRVALPSRFRQVAERNADKDDARLLTVGRHPELPCLMAYDASWNFENYDLIDSRARTAEDAASFNRLKERWFGSVDEATFDASGRFFLHPLQRKRAEIAEFAFFAGAGRTFNIWAPHVLLSCSDADEDTRDMCAYYMETKGAKA